MKNLKNLLFALIVVFLVSCGSDSITPLSERIQGPLGEFFQVVSKNYKVKDGKVCIEIKRIKAGFPIPWKEGMEVGYSTGEMEPQFIAEFQDADGSIVSKDHTEIWDQEELNAVAALGVDETASITFDINDEAVKVKIGSTFMVHVDSKSDSYSYSTNVEEETQEKITEEVIDVTQVGQRKCHIDGPANVRQQPNTKSNIMGSINDGMVAIVSQVSDNIWKIHSVYNPQGGQAYTGNVIGYYTHKQNLIFDIDDSSSDNSFYSYSSSSSSAGSAGSQDWDALLNSYEQYVDKYISLLKKTSNGDMSAWAEYSSFVQKAHEFSEKMQNAQGDMSASQWARYMKITNKMAQAAQNMQ